MIIGLGGLGVIIGSGFVFVGRVFFSWFLFPLCVFRECGGSVLIVLPICSAALSTGSICWFVLEAGEAW